MGSNPTGGMDVFVCCECSVLSGRGVCDELITRPEESYRLRCVVVCDLEASRMRRPWPTGGCGATGKKKRDVLYQYFRQGISSRTVLSKRDAISMVNPYLANVENMVSS